MTDRLARGDDALRGDRSDERPVRLPDLYALPFIGDEYDGALGGLGYRNSEPLVRPLFEKSGIGDRFFPWQEKYPGATAGDTEESE